MKKLICIPAILFILSGCGQAAAGLGTEVVIAEAEELLRNGEAQGNEGTQGHGEAQGNEGTQGHGEAQANKTVQDIYGEIIDAVALCAPMTMSEAFISNYYGINPQQLAEYVFSISEEATSAETVVIMKVRDEADIADISAALQVVVDEKRKEMENYLPEQFEIVDKSTVRTKGSYVYLVISDKEDEISRMIEAGI